MTTATVEQELLELEKDDWRAIKDKDVEAAMRLSDDRASWSGRRASPASTGCHWPK